MKLRLYELDLYHTATGHVHRWYLCAGSRGYQSRSTDTPANVTWLPLVGQAASVAVRATEGGARSEIDDLRLINVRASDSLPRHANVYDVTAGTWLRVELGIRPLNPLLTDYAAAQRMVEMEVEDTAAYSSAVTVWQAKAGLIGLDRTEIRVPVWDRLVDFDAPVQVEKYAGTGGTEGPAELKDVTKERCFGHCVLVAPTYLGIIGGKHVYSTNGGHPVEDVVKAWDKAAPYTKVSGTPSPGQYSVDVSTGIITCGGSSGGGAKPEDFRVEIEGDKLGGTWRRYIGEIVGYLATTHSGLVSAADVSGMDATPRTVGLYLPAGDTASHRDAYQRLVGSVPRGRWYIDLADQIVVTRLPRSEDATPTLSYRKAAGETPGLKPLSRTQRVPAKQVVVRYAQNPNPTDATAGVATAGDVALWSKQWREEASSTDTTVATAWGTAAKVEYIETALTLQADAAAEAPEWLAELSNPPQPYELKVRDGAPGLWIGGAVSVTDDMAGFEAGATVIVTGRTNRDRGDGATLYVER